MRTRHRLRVWFRIVLITMIAIASGRAASMPSARVVAQVVDGTMPVSVQTTPLASPSACSGTFVAHDLDHSTSTADGIVRMFEANGSGVAVNDLDNDGDLDLVLGNHAGPNSLFWNEGAPGGHPTWRKEEFGNGYTRAITVVDVDSDGWRDIVLTLNTGTINYWRNLGNGDFRQEVLPGVSYLAYSLAWGDVDIDGDLDLVTASYDAGLLTDVGNNFLLAGGGSVVSYIQGDKSFIPTRLTTEAQGLALLLADLNTDGRPDILVGNDYALQDQLWLRTAPSGANPRASWVDTQPFDQTSQSTMSIDWGDIANDGSLAIFTADMNPYDISPRNLAAWLPIMTALPEVSRREDPQRVANALQIRQPGGQWRDEALYWGVEATGWSWASKFGDLDNDGYLDLYVVNGMIEERMFKHLPNHELVEENQAFRNNGRGRFVRTPEWQLNSSYSGRSMVMADLDQDGDLDIVVNNLRGPAQLFENQLCGGDSVQVELRWPQMRNRDALGAVVKLYTSNGVYTRDVRAASGYLAGDPARVHFGVPQAAQIERLEVRWPDGMMSVVEEVEQNTLLTIQREAVDASLTTVAGP
jgi:hypothetical protein